MTTRRSFFGLLAAAPVAGPAIAKSAMAQSDAIPFHFHAATGERILPICSFSTIDPSRDFRWHWNPDGSGFGYPIEDELG